MAIKSYKLPNFLVVGAAKSGSTSMYNYLKEHPEIYMPPLKENRFLVSEELNTVAYYKSSTIFDFETYTKQFENADGYKVVGETANTYLYYTDLAIANIKKYLGENVKITMVLREPVDRAFSAYQFACRNIFEDLTFEQALAAEKSRMLEKVVPPDIMYYAHAGLYYDMVKAYKDAFQDVKVYFTFELKEEPQQTISNLLSWLEVNPDFKIDVTKKHNEGGWVPANSGVLNYLFADKKLANKIKPILQKTPALYKAGEQVYKGMERLRDKMVIKKKIILEPSIEEKLKGFFRDDILKLQDLTGKNLDRWLKA